MPDLDLSALALPSLVELVETPTPLAETSPPLVELVETLVAPTRKAVHDA